jgi:hypothetical protein
MDGYDGDDFNSDRNGNLDASYGNDDGTRDFLAGDNPVLASGLYEGFTDPPQPYLGSTSVNPPRLEMESLDLNNGAGWLAWRPTRASFSPALRAVTGLRLPCVCLLGATSTSSRLAAPAAKEQVKAQEVVPRQRL